MTDNAFINAVLTARDAFSDKLSTEELDRFAVMTAMGFRIASGKTNPDWVLGEAIVYRLIMLAYAKGLCVKVYDPDEDRFVEHDTFAATFIEATACDENTICLYRGAERLGVILLFPGNGCDTICDHTVHPTLEEIVNAVQEEFPS